MIKSTGLKKLRTAIFISGTGTNLKNLIKFSLSKKSPIKICLIVSNNPNAEGLKFSTKYKIKHKIFKYRSNNTDEKKALHHLNKNKINLICLAGYMKILSENFIKCFNGPILNIHPSLLPKYKGLNTHERVINNKEKYTGCTVHFVDSKLDSGKVVLQKKIKLFKNDTPSKLAKRVLKQEHILYPKAIMKLFANS